MKAVSQCGGVGVWCGVCGGRFDLMMCHACGGQVSINGTLIRQSAGIED